MDTSGDHHESLDSEKAISNKAIRHKRGETVLIYLGAFSIVPLFLILIITFDIWSSNSNAQKNLEYLRVAVDDAGLSSSVYEWQLKYRPELFSDTEITSNTGWLKVAEGMVDLMSPLDQNFRDYYVDFAKPIPPELRQDLRQYEQQLDGLYNALQQHNEANYSHVDWFDVNDPLYAKVLRPAWMIVRLTELNVTRFTYDQKKSEIIESILHLRIIRDALADSPYPDSVLQSVNMLRFSNRVLRDALSRTQLDEAALQKIQDDLRDYVLSQSVWDSYLVSHEFELAHVLDQLNSPFENFGKTELTWQPKKTVLSNDEFSNWDLDRDYRPPNFRERFSWQWHQIFLQLDQGQIIDEFLPATRRSLDALTQVRDKSIWDPAVASMLEQAVYPGDDFVLWLLPTVNFSLLDFVKIAIVDAQVTAAALDAEIFRMRTGRWPSSIEEIDPALRNDPQTGIPLVIEPLRQIDGSSSEITGIRIYSLGPNGQDDGGYSWSDYQALDDANLHNSDADDIGFSLVAPEHRPHLNQ